MSELCSLRLRGEGETVEVIDQTLLPHQLQWLPLASLDSYCHAITSMQVRGAPLIGITAAFGLAAALAKDPSNDHLQVSKAALLATRPTAVNLHWALQKIETCVLPLEEAQRAQAAFICARELREQDIEHCSTIGEFGCELLQSLFDKSAGETLHVMTHCNAGWLATIQWGTALSPIYKAHRAGVPIHVWVSETRPRNQGAYLTAWELQRAGVPCTIVADNSCGYLMQAGEVDCVIVGSDRTAANGDVCNKVGTYLKALAAQANAVPFYAAVPESTIDWSCPGGADIPIEFRDSEELLSITGIDDAGELQTVRLAGVDSRGKNPAFDITPAALVSGLITEHGVIEASSAGLAQLRSTLASL
ncbi:MAG: S-methyl-5-thioribose-1-phosphate isomerase [Proteobacteria bacterium]|nr:S-methyl-5-thioribose-1-phosphate isomerase [Pseudomonadota bacterium]